MLWPRVPKPGTQEEEQAARTQVLKILCQLREYQDEIRQQTTQVETLSARVPGLESSLENVASKRKGHSANWQQHARRRPASNASAATPYRSWPWTCTGYAPWCSGGALDNMRDTTEPTLATSAAECSDPAACACPWGQVGAQACQGGPIRAPGRAYVRQYGYADV